jgi:hypothetical protein
LKGDVLLRSRLALERLMHEVGQALDRGEEVLLTVERE